MEQINKQTWVGTKEKFLQLPEIETNKSYYITDLASFGISSEDMELALTTEASLYDIDSIFICFNEGTYKKGHIYKFLGNDWEDITSGTDIPGINILQGTEEIPINLYNDLEVNRLYSIGGVIYNSESNLTLHSSVLAYKADSNRIYLLGTKLDIIANTIAFEPNCFTILEVEATGEISTYQTSIAPVNSGTPGQVLTSNGPDEAPTWQDISVSNTNTSASLTSGSAELNFSEVDGAPDYAALTCNKPLYIGQPDKDLYLDADLMHGFFERGWDWQAQQVDDETGDYDTAVFAFHQSGGVELSSTNQRILLDKATGDIILQSASVRANNATTDLGESNFPWSNIYGKNIYQNGSKVLTQNDIALYKHNVSLNGTSDSGKKINARVVCLTRSNVLITTYGQLVNSITGAVDYPINGYVYDENDTFFGTIIYFDYNVGNIFEFTVAAPTGIETISLSTAQITIADTAVLVE